LARVVEILFSRINEEAMLDNKAFL